MAPAQGGVMLVCSPGGHLMQLLQLREAWKGQKPLWITLERSDARSLLRLGAGRLRVWPDQPQHSEFAAEPAPRLEACQARTSEDSSYYRRRPRCAVRVDRAPTRSLRRLHREHRTDRRTILEPPTNRTRRRTGFMCNGPNSRRAETPSALPRDGFREAMILVTVGTSDTPSTD